jgi:hypothetical protein
MFENRMLRKTFGPKTVEKIGGLRNLHNKELYNFYSSSNISRMTKLRRIRWAEQVARIGEMRHAYETLVGKPKGRRLYGINRRRWEDITKMYLKKVV